MDVQCAGRGLRKMQLKVLHLDDTVHTFQLSVHATGQELHASMVDRLHLLESDYFDLEYVNDEGMRCWLDHDKPILRQISPGRDLLFRFGVKFYTPYPNLLDEECTRYLFALQVKRDLVTGTLLCSENTAALLASYVVQAEIGDFMEEEYHSIDYLRPLKLLHDPTDDRLQRVMEFHKAHLGLSPSEADLALLDTARKVEFYGLRLHFVRNHEGLGLNLAVSHLGILVFQNLIRINTFSWAKIRKLSFKRKRFLVKLQPERFDNIEFIFDSREECKHFWKHCIEHHTFFRCPKAEQALSKQGQPGQRFSRSGSTFRYTGRTEQELHEYVQEHGENRINFERPSSARRAYSTLLSGSSYTSKRLQTASLQLRSSSADRRAVTMFSNNLGVSLTNTLGHSSGLKRTQSEGTRPAARDSQEESAVMVSGQSNADELPEAPTSGYVTTTESAGSRQSTDANIVPETEEDMATNMERLEDEQVSEMDPLRWITETYRRMTGDWTGEGVLAEEKQDTSTVMRRAKSAAGSPRTSGTASLGRLDTELDSLLLHQQQGAPTVQIAAAEDDGALTHFLLLSEISRTIVPGATIQTGPDTSQSDRQGETSLQVSSPTEQQQQTSDILSDLTGAVLFSGTDISDLVSRVVSPYPEMSSEREEVRVSSSLSTTQPDLLSQADAGLSQRGCVHPATDLFGDAHRVAAPLADTCTQQPSGSEAASVVSSFLTQPTGAQIQQTPTEFLDDLNLRAGQSAVFILPTVTQYGLDINIDRSQQQIRSFDPTPAEAVSSTHPPHHSEAEPTAQSNLGSESVTFQNYSLQSGFPYSQTSWSTVTPAYSVPSVPEPDGRKFVLASVHPEPLTYGAGQTAGALKNKFQSRQPKSSLGTSLLSSRSTGQIPASGVSTAAYPFFPRETVEVRRSRPPTEPLQAAPFDRWSSSGSDSTTGVILRPELSKTELGNGNIRTNSSGSLLRQHKTGCPHASASTRQSQPSTQITSAMSVTSSNQLPILPVDTLPARPSHHRNMLAHTCGQSSILSHSIPCDVHLSGLHAEMRRIEAYRHIGVKDSDVNKNTKKTSNERQLRRPYPRGYPFGGGGGGGEHTHTDMLPMELTDSAAAEMLEEVPYVVIRRPRSVDVKQYQLHLQRQQQQAAAMAAAAAGYPFHPGAPPFFGESHHHHAAAAAAAAAAYHYSGRMPVAPQFTYGPMPTAYHHHHHQAPVAPSRSELPPDVKCGRSAKHHSVGPGDHRSDARQERARQARPSQQALHHHERFPEGLDPYAPVAPMHREKCKAKRKHSKTPESSMVKEYDANQSKRHTKPATGATPALDDVLHHHAQCVHRRRLMDPNMPEESTEKRAVMQAKRQVRPKPTSTTADSGSKQPATRAGSSGRSPSRTKDVPVLEAGDSRQKRRTAEPLDDSRETEVPYPVSEIFFSPARGSESADTRQSKLPSAARHHHHHHPACASLMGRTRASQLQKQPLKPAKITTSDAALASASVPQLQRGQMRDEPALKMSARSWASDDRYPLDRGSIVPQARADRMSRKQEDPAVRPVMSDTRETIEKLRQELRSAGFQVKDTLPSRTVTDWGRPSSMGSGHQPIGTKSTTKPSHKPVPKTSPSEQKPTEIAHGSIESRKPAGTPSDVTEPDKPVAQAAISLATAGGVDLPFGGPPRNPIYLDSDTDSEEVSRQRKEPDVVSRPQDSQEILREPLSTTASTMETIEAPAGDQEGELSVDVTETGRVQPVISPRSPSPSLPLSFVPCDGGDDETDVSLGSQASLLNSPDSASYCSTCDRIDSYDSPSPSSSHSCCHSHHRRRYHSSCHGHRRHHHGHRHHGHYRSHRYYHRNYTCRCHSCVSHHHRRHLSDQRNAYRESRHHSVKPYRVSHRVDSSPHKPQRSSSDRRHGYGTSSSEPSELSWTNSLSESSAQDEIPGDHWIEDALTLERRSMIVEELLAKEQKLRAQIAKHRALAYELKQTREQTQKLLGPEPRRQAGRLGRKGDVSEHSKDKGMDDSVRSTSKKGSEASSHKGSTVVSRQKEGGPTKEDKHVDEGHPNRKHGVTKDERAGTKQSHAVRPARHYRHLHPNRRHPGSKSSSRSPRDRSADLRDSFLEHQKSSVAVQIAVQDNFVIENTAALADGDGELDSPEKPSVDLKKETQVKVVEDGKTESAEERQPTQMTLATLELEDIEENTVYSSDVELQTTSFVQSVEPQHACMLTTGNITSIEVTKFAEPPKPPSTAPPLAAGISSTLDTSPSDFVTTSGEQVSQAPKTDHESIESKPKPKLSSINQLSDLDVSADQTDADSEYDGTHVINMLSEIIESSLSGMRLTDSQDQHTTDGSTQASSLCDDIHTSEASMETVKAAHSPTRLGSPSNSSTSASEGSEDIEPFPPPPPESLVDLYLAHDGTLTHTHHLFSGALDEVIEEEGGVGEPESDVCGTTIHSDADSTLVERTTDEEKQDSSSPEHKVGENFTDGELTNQVETNFEASTEQGSTEIEISANEAEQQGSAFDSVQAPKSHTLPEDVQMNEDIDRDTAMPVNLARQTENVDDSSRTEAELPSDAAVGESIDEQLADQSATDSSPTTQPITGENTPDQPAIADACDQTGCKEVISDTNDT